MTPEKFEELRRTQAARQYIKQLFDKAWLSIATERGYRVDMWLGTSSHGTIAIQSFLRANGV